MSLPDLPQPDIVDIGRFGVAWRDASMRAYGRQCFAAGMESAAVICNDIGGDNKWSDANDAASAIRRQAASGEACKPE